MEAAVEKETVQGETAKVWEGKVCVCVCVCVCVPPPGSSGPVLSVGCTSPVDLAGGARELSSAQCPEDAA